MTVKQMKQQTELTLSVLFRGYEAILSEARVNNVYGHITGVLNTLWNLELITDARFDELSERNYNQFVKVIEKIGEVER